LDDGLWRAVRDLPSKQRAAVVHRFVLDLDYRSIAERMGTTEEAARQSVSAGLRRLRKEIDR
jgi:RNA polymerase sigma factor (sigma-70 family)